MRKQEMTEERELAMTELLEKAFDMLSDIQGGMDQEDWYWMMREVDSWFMAYGNAEDKHGPIRVTND